MEREGGELDPLRREAIAWVVRLTSGDARAADAEAVRAWRGRSAQHDAAFREAAGLWRAAGLAASVSAAPLDRRAFLRRAAIAASAAGFAALGGAALLSLSAADLLADHRTGVGERRRIALSDGSEAELNAQSAMSVRFERTERSVELISGEAVFSVAHNPDMPFVVVAGGVRTTALGTVFGVRRDARGETVTCLEGAVQVAPAGGLPVTLVAGQQVAYGGGRSAGVALVDPSAALAWRQGLLVFRDAPLAQVADELNRHRRGRILVAGSELAGRRISGAFHLDRMEEALGQIESALGARRVQITDRFVLLY